MSGRSELIFKPKINWVLEEEIMNIAIEHSKTARVIKGAFNISGDKKDLLEIAI